MKRKITAIIIGLCATVCATVAASVVTKVNGSGGAVWSDVEISEVYAYGDTFAVPDRTLTIDGNGVKSLYTVTFPSGKTVRTKSVKLNETGNYTLRYYASVANKQYAAEEKFGVQGFGYRVDSDESSVKFDRYTDFGADSEGLLVRLANGDKLTFTKPINVSALNRKDALVRFFITPEHQGAADFNKLTFTLTDVTDESKYLKIDVNRSQFSGNGLGISWVMGGGNDQDMAGYEKGKMIHVNDDVGTPMYNLSFVAQENSGSWDGPARNIKPDLKHGVISFDYESKILYANAETVADLDSSDYYKDLWSGFSSENVRLTVSASGYSSATARFCLTEVLGLSADELKNNTFVDDEPPVITVDGDFEEMPTALIGRDYPVPVATAYDGIAGECDVQTEIVYGYYTDSPVSVSFTGGAFKPDRPGSYAIIYTAADGFGNKNQKILFVRAANKTPDITINLPTLPTEVELGTFVEIPKIEASGGSGRITVEVAVVFAGERKIVENGFRPEEAGEYTIEITATDYVGVDKTETLTVNAVKGDKPLFVDDVYLPPVYVGGGRYVLPELYANDYTSGKLVRKLCDVKVKDANGENTYKSGSEFIPAVNENGDEITITYFVGDASYTPFEIPVIIGREDKTVFMQNYLSGDDVTVSSRDENNVRYTTGLAVIPAAGRSEWTFANSLLAEQASLIIETVGGKTNFGAFEFSLTDAANGKKITVTLSVGSGKVGISHGKNDYSVAASLKTGGKLGLTYESSKITVVVNDSSTVVVPVTEYADGERFDGFVSPKIYLSLATTDNKSESRYKVLSVCENVLSYRNQDNNAPSFTILGDYGGKQKINTHYVVKRGVASDVFAPESKVTLTVTASDGKVMKDENGRLLDTVKADEDYVIKLTEYGQYTLAYKISEVDWVGKSRNFSVNVVVADEEPPKITFTGGGTKSAKAGDVIVMPKYKVSDNLSSSKDISVHVFVLTAKGKLIELTNGSNSIKCAYSGKYTFIVYATDAAGNSSSLTYSVNVA